MVASCGALSIRTVTSTQSVPGSRTRCSAEASWQNRAQMRSSLAGTGLWPRKAEGSQERRRPVAPFANRFAGSMFASSITRIACGRSSPGHGGSFAHWPARTRLVRHWERTLRVILATFCLLRYHPARLPFALKQAFTFSLLPPRAAIRLSTRRFHRFRYARFENTAVGPSNGTLRAEASSFAAPRTYASTRNFRTRADTRPWAVSSSTSWNSSSSACFAPSPSSAGATRRFCRSTRNSNCRTTCLSPAMNGGRPVAGGSCLKSTKMRMCDRPNLSSRGCGCRRGPALGVVTFFPPTSGGPSPPPVGEPAAAPAGGGGAGPDSGAEDRGSRGGRSSGGSSSSLAMKASGPSSWRT